jgi:hypothetical protein
LVSDQLRQVGALNNFHDNIKIPVLNEGLVELNNVGVLELLVDLDLPELFVDLLAGHLWNLESFESILVVTFLGQVDATECPLTDLLY